MSTAVAAGTALGAATGGLLTERAGVTATLVFAFAGVVAAALAALATRDVMRPPAGRDDRLLTERGS